MRAQGLGSTGGKERGACAGSNVGRSELVSNCIINKEYKNNQEKNQIGRLIINNDNEKGMKDRSTKIVLFLVLSSLLLSLSRLYISQIVDLRVSRG
jgi:hypothetical protein